MTKKTQAANAKANSTNQLQKLNTQIESVRQSAALPIMDSSRGMSDLISDKLPAVTNGKPRRNDVTNRSYKQMSSNHDLIETTKREVAAAKQLLMNNNKSFAENLKNLLQKQPEVGSASNSNF
mmetsp:Transcript_37132/g.56982  ORF Transcript_37132/g.56982 Transcript_37132/m.56982 type:complete len:123 (+) Transcript_37132:3138-3506(+)